MRDHIDGMAGGCRSYDLPGVSLKLPFALDIGATHMRAVMIPDQSDIRFSKIETPSADRLGEAVRTLLAAVGADGGPRGGIGLSRAAGIDKDGTIIAWPSRSDWIATNLLEIIRRETGCTAIFDIDDGMAAALWEHAAGSFPHYCTVAVLSIGTGLGVGIVRAGVLQSTGDGAGTLGHAPIGISDRMCRCGQYGCLQATLADPSISGDLFSHYLLRARNWLADRFGVDRIVVTGGSLRLRADDCLAVAGVSLSTVPDASAVLGAALFARRGTDARDADLTPSMLLRLASALGKPSRHRSLRTSRVPR
jgi:hypothetical protein